MAVNVVRVIHLEYDKQKVGVRFEIINVDGSLNLFDVSRQRLDRSLLEEWDRTVGTTHVFEDQGDLLVTPFEQRFKIMAVDISNNPAMLQRVLDTRLIHAPYTPESQSVQWGSNIVPPHALLFKNGVLALIEGFGAVADYGRESDFDIKSRSVDLTWLFLSEVDAKRFFAVLENHDLSVARFKEDALAAVEAGTGVRVSMPLRKLLEIYKGSSFSLGLDYGRVEMKVKTPTTELQWIVETGVNGPYRHPLFTNPDFYSGQGAKPNMLEINQSKAEARKMYMPFAVRQSAWAVAMLQQLRDSGMLTLYQTGITAPVLADTGWKRLRAIRM